MTDLDAIDARAAELYDELLEAQHTSDAIGKALRLPYRAIPLQPIADMRLLVADLMGEIKSLRVRLARYEARGE